MLRIVLLGILAAATVLPARPSLAYGEGQWCLIYQDGERCDFPTVEACRRELRGSASFCNLNPRYPGNWSMQPQPRA